MFILQTTKYKTTMLKSNAVLNTLNNFKKLNFFKKQADDQKDDAIKDSEKIKAYKSKIKGKFGIKK